MVLEQVIQFQYQKTIKIIANKKNRIENGTRALWFGSNPHSKGEDFSRSTNDRTDTTQDTTNNKNGKIIATNLDIIINLI